MLSCGCEVILVPSLNTGKIVAMVSGCGGHLPRPVCPRRSFRRAKRRLADMNGIKLGPFFPPAW